jgi:hypothetical protein
MTDKLLRKYTVATSVGQSCDLSSPYRSNVKYNHCSLTEKHVSGVERRFVRLSESTHHGDTRAANRVSSRDRLQVPRASVTWLASRFTG